MKNGGKLGASRGFPAGRRLCNPRLAFLRQWLAIQKLRSKIKKKVDRKASKGRRIRWVTASVSKAEFWFCRIRSGCAGLALGCIGRLIRAFEEDVLLWGIQMSSEPSLRLGWMWPVSIAQISVGKCHWSQRIPERRGQMSRAVWGCNFQWKPVNPRCAAYI